MKSALIALVVAALAGAACGNDSQSVTAPSTSSGTTQTFSGVLGPQGSSFYSFTVTTAETLGISLASLTATGVGPASAAVVRLGLGVPVGTGCSVNNSVDTAPGLAAQLTSSVNPDVYCVNISDVGNLTGPMNFTIRIVENPPPTSSSSNTTGATETFASFLAVGGTSAHTFSVSQPGNIGLTLNSVTPSIIIGLGIGIPSSPNCVLSSSVDATPGSSPQLTVAVDPGTYCAQVYDIGNLTTPGVAFSMTITHP